MKIKKLRFFLKRYAYFYYTLGHSLIPDVEYDYLIRILQKLEKKKHNLYTENNVLNKIGSKLSPDFFKIKHLSPMLSLNNIFSVQSWESYYKRLCSKLGKKKISITSELKFDGIAVSLLYKHGKLIHAATRGNGYIGEDITENVFIIKYIPIYLNNFDIPNVLEIRGEILILSDDFLKLNKQLLKINKNIFSNPRNAVYGILRKKNIDNFYLDKLTFFCHSYGVLEGEVSFLNHYDFMLQCKKWGFFVHDSIKLFNSIKDVMNYHFFVQNNKNTLGFNIDGIVLKLNNIIDQNILGCSNTAPKWAIAWKFKSEEKQTKVLNVQFKVGKTGIITPIAILQPIRIAGVIIQKASLYNKQNIKKLDIYIGDTVILVRAGEVIPKIVYVIKAFRNKKCSSVIFPKYCPICNSKIKKYKDFSALYCSGGFHCKAQLKERLVHFCSPLAFNIKGLGNSILKKLIKYKFVKNFSDLFTLNVTNLSILPGIGKKKSINILNSLEYSKKISLSRFIYALCITNIGVIKSNKLANYCISIDNFLSISKKNKNSFLFLGKENVENIILYINNNSNRKCILNLLKFVNID
ncbi:NAD-dependent DNA ligase LigA [Buchnera aphidicola (Mollitrichosiphum nigrofasciatum)]|uniref:NAD-dependent DNA ligase LigA n=1 Tax=Buchnera aphidicola TaxID=9 RepID=UPI0031B7F6FA